MSDGLRLRVGMRIRTWRGTVRVDWIKRREVGVCFWSRHARFGQLRRGTLRNFATSMQKEPTP